MKIIAVLEMINCDDGVISINTGCIDGNGKPSIVQINENRCIVIDEKLKKFLLENWDKWCNSPEYVLYELLSTERKSK